MKMTKSVRSNGVDVSIRIPRREDWPEFEYLVEHSLALHEGLVTPPRLEETFESTYLVNADTETEKRFLVLEAGKIAGTVSISQIFLKGFCSAYLGYYLFEGFTGRGVMSSALTLVLGMAFDELGLHRLEANIQPGNLSSIKLVKELGFSKEGFSRNYLKVAGEWCDHERWAILKEDWRH